MCHGLPIPPTVYTANNVSEIKPSLLWTISTLCVIQEEELVTGPEKATAY